MHFTGKIDGTESVAVTGTDVDTEFEHLFYDIRPSVAYGPHQRSKTAVAGRMIHIESLPQQAFDKA